MAKVTGVGTGWKGKVGNFVFQMWKGVQVVKTRVIPTNPNSSGQQASRNLLGDIVGVFKAIAVTWIRFFWNPFTEGRQSGWGNFIGVNLLSMSSGFDIGDVVSAIGTLDGVADLAATYDTATGIVAITWDAGSPVSGTPEDKFNFLVYDTDQREFLADSYGGSERADESDDVTIASGLTATNLYLVACLSDVNPEEDVISSCSDGQVVQMSAAP